MKKTLAKGRICPASYKTSLFQGILAGKGGKHMNIRTLRAWLTGVAMTLALLMTSGVLAWQLTAPVQAGGNAAASDSGEYLLVDQAGQICIYSDGSLISNTGIPVRALPELDRIALAQGIHAKGQRQLAALLEDFGG